MKTQKVKEIKTAAEVFTKCPSCKSKTLSKFDQEVFCKFCNWNSIQASIDAGVLDETLKNVVMA